MQEALLQTELEFDKSALFIQEWTAEGREEGIRIGEHQGLCYLTLRLIHHRLGEIDEATQERVRALPNHQVEKLGEALLDFTALADLHQWLSDNADGAQAE